MQEMRPKIVTEFQIHPSKFFCGVHYFFCEPTLLGRSLRKNKLNFTHSDSDSIPVTLWGLIMLGFSNNTSNHKSSCSNYITNDIGILSIANIDMTNDIT